MRAEDAEFRAAQLEEQVRSGNVEIEALKVCQC